MSNAPKLRDTWYSPRVQRDMTVVRYGHYGTPVLLCHGMGSNRFNLDGPGDVSTSTWLRFISRRTLPWGISPSH